VLGFLGARAAYVSTHLSRFEDRWYAVFFIWEGGLALFGGLTVGTIAAVAVVRRAGSDPWVFADAAAVGIPLAQAIGRWGNYFNQELFGTPTDLPWGLEIDPANRPAEYAEFATFHPTFLYESLWNVVVTVGVILWLERRGKLTKGASIAIYLLVYGTGRFLMELMRTDTSFRLLGLSRNGWVSMGAVVGGAVLLWWFQKRGERRTLVGEQVFIAPGAPTLLEAVEPAERDVAQAEDGRDLTFGDGTGDAPANGDT